MTTVQALSVVFLLAMVMLIIRGIRGHSRRNEEVELDATGRAAGSGTMRMSQQLDSITISSSGGAGGGD